MSNIDIKVNIVTDEAESKVNKIEGDIKQVKENAEKPVNIKVDADVSAATSKTNNLRDALANVKATGLEELSQKAGELGRQLGGVAGDLVEIGIKSAASFGPMGIVITAVGAAIALALQYQKELNQETENVAGLATIQRNLGASYGDVANAIRGAKDSTEALSTAIRVQQELLRNQVTLLNQGYNTTQINEFRASGEQLVATLQATDPAAAQVNQRMLDNALASRDAGAMQTYFGIQMQFSGDRAKDLATFLSLASQRTIELRREAQISAQNIASASGREVIALQNRRQNTEDLNAEIEGTSDRLIQNIRTGESATRTSRTFSLANNEVRNAFAQNTAATQQNTAATSVADDVLKRKVETTHSHTQALNDENAAKLKAVETQQALNNMLSSLMERAITEARQRRTEEEAGITAQYIAERKLFDQTQQFAQAERDRTQRTREYIEAQRALGIAQRDNLASQASQEVGGETGIAAQVIDPTVRERLALRNEEVEATRQLTMAQTELNRVNEEYNRTTVRTPELDQRRVQAINNVTAATNRQTAVVNRQGSEMSRVAATGLTDLKNGLGGVASGLVSTGIAAAIAGENIGDALQKSLAASLTALAQESAVKALFETAQGLAMLFTAPPAAGAHFAAAGMYAAVAVAAGVGAAALTPSTTTQPISPATNDSISGKGESPSRPESQMDKAPANITINLNAFQSNSAAQDLIVRSLREAGYSGRNVPGIRR